MEYHVLAIGDVVGENGLRHLEKSLRPLQRLKDIAFTVVNGENASGVGLTPEQAEYIYQNGVLKDMSAGDIGRVWLWQGAQYNKEILEDGCEISIALSRYNEQTKKFESDEFYTYVLSSSVHTYACLRELDILN